MEDPDFFYYAKSFLKVHGFYLDTERNTWKSRLWAIINIFFQQYMLLTLLYNVIDKHPDIVLMVTCSTVVFGFVVNSFKIMTVNFKIKRLGEFYRCLIEYWNIREFYVLNYNSQITKIFFCSGRQGKGHSDGAQILHEYRVSGQLFESHHGDFVV